MAIDPSILFRAQPYTPPAFDFGRPLVLAEELARARQQREAQAFGLGQAQEQAERQRTWRGAAAELALGQPQQPQSPDFVPQLDANGQQVLQSYVGMDPGSGVGPRGQQALLKRLETTMRLQQEALQDGTQGGYERVRTKAAEELDVPTANSMPDTFDAAQVQRRYEQTRQVYDQLQARQSSQTPRPTSEARRRLYEADPVAAQQYETSLREGSRKEILAQAETVGQLLQGVTDDPGYQEVLPTLDRIAPGHRLPRTYDKARVDQAKAQALSVKETVDAQIRGLTAQAAGTQAHANLLKAGQPEIGADMRGALVARFGAKPTYTDQEYTQARQDVVGPQQAKQDLERQKLQFELQKAQREASGVLSDPDRRTFQLKLRENIRQEPTFKIYTQVRNGLENVQVGARLKDSAGDLAIVNGYAKILDPEGAVREGEFKTVEQAQGFFDRMLNQPGKIWEGNRLTPGVRERFLAAATELGQQKQATADKELRTVYEPLARDTGLDFGQLLAFPQATGGGGAGSAAVSGMSDAELYAARDRLRAKARE